MNTWQQRFNGKLGGGSDRPQRRDTVNRRRRNDDRHVPDRQGRKVHCRQGKDHTRRRVPGLSQLLTGCSGRLGTRCRRRVPGSSVDGVLGHRDAQSAGGTRERGCRRCPHHQRDGGHTPDGPGSPVLHWVLVLGPTARQHAQTPRTAHSARPDTGCPRAHRCKRKRADPDVRGGHP